MPIIAIQEKLSRFSDGTVRATRPIADLARFRAEGGTIIQLDIYVDFPADELNLIADADNIFTMRINGVDQFPTFGDKPLLPGNGDAVTIDGLSFAVADGDVVSFDLVAAGAAGLTAPVYFRVLIDAVGLQSPVEAIGIALSDLTTDLTTGIKAVIPAFPYNFEVEEVIAGSDDAPTGAALIVDILEGGVSILDDLLQIDDGETSSLTSAAPATIDDAAITKGSKVEFEITQIGSTNAGKGLVVWLVGRRTA